jgi:hypothetical protein
MAKPGRTLTIYLAADTSKATREMEGFAGKMKSVVGPALLGAAAAAGMFALKLGVDAVQGAIAEQAEISKLNELLRKNGFPDAAADVDAFLSKQAQLTTYTDDELRPAFQKLFIATNDVTAAQDLLTIAMDTSLGTGKDLSAVTVALSKAVDGNSTSLRKMVPGLDAIAIKSGEVDLITQELAKHFGGQATKAAQTWEGQLGNVADAFGELQDSFGKGFLDGLSAAMGPEGGDTGINGMTQAMIDLQPEFEEIGRLIGDSIGDLIWLAREVIKVKDAFEDWKDTLTGTGWEAIFNGIGRATAGLLNPLGEIRNMIEAIQAAIDKLKGTSIPSSGGSWGGNTRSMSAATKSTAPQYNITVQAGVGNPVEIARSIENILRTRNTRLGMI